MPLRSGNWAWEGVGQGVLFFIVSLGIGFVTEVLFALLSGVFGLYHWMLVATRDSCDN